MNINVSRYVGPAIAAVTVIALAAGGTVSEPELRWRSTSSTAAPALSLARSAPTEITLAFGGDVHFTGRTRDLLDDPQTAIGPFARVLREADLAMVNLETAVTERGTPEPKTYHFRAPVTAYDALAAAGIDVISLANNHTLDYGQVGFADTLDSAEAAGMPYVGAGRDSDAANAPYLTTVAGVRVAVLGFSQVRELADSWAATDSRPGIAMAFDTDRAAEAVARANAEADLVVVYLHWGHEGNPCPTQDMQSFAALMEDSGADVVVGTHAHVLLGTGWLDDTYVDWGLGNFVWYSNSLDPPASTDTGVLQLTVRDHRVTEAEFLPGVVSGTGQPEPIDGQARDELERRLARANECAGLDRKPG